MLALGFRGLRVSHVAEDLVCVCDAVAAQGVATYAGALQGPQKSQFKSDPDKKLMSLFGVVSW